MVLFLLWQPTSRSGREPWTPRRRWPGFLREFSFLIQKNFRASPRAPGPLRKGRREPDLRQLCRLCRVEGNTEK